MTYSDGTQATVEQEAHDVATFLAWASDPKMEERKQMGFRVLIFLVALRRVCCSCAYRRSGPTSTDLCRRLRSRALPNGRPEMLKGRVLQEAPFFMTKTVLGVIGGSGVYEIPGLENPRGRLSKAPGASRPTSF